MKKLSILLLLLTSSAYAVVFEIKNLCDDSAYHKESIQILTTTNVGHLTLNTFKTSNIEFIGNESGMNSILGTPIGLDAMEVLDDNHMRAYGWCYDVDGKQPDMLASEYPIDPNSDCKLTWFYGYAEYLNGEWISYCTPTHLNPNSFVCD